MFIRKYKRGLASLLVVGSFFTTILVGCDKKEDASATPKAKGFQWEVKKDDKTMYLIGTMHPINKGYDYFTDTVNNIVEKTDVLAVEINPTQEEILKVNADGVYAGDDSIEKELNKEQVEKLKSICNETGIQYEKIKILKPNMVVNNLEAVLYDKAGLTMETFDDMLMKDIKSKKKEIVQLESIGFQMDLLNKIGGIQSLKATLDAHEDGKFIDSGKEVIEYSEGLMDGYVKGDTKVMEDAIKTQKQSPEAYDLMITKRNKAMVEKMEDFFKEDKTYTIAVGALHFFGDDGIVKMMKDKGYEVNIME